MDTLLMFFESRFIQQYSDNIHKYHSHFIPERVAEIYTFYQNVLAMKKTAGVKGNKPIAV
jgi:hypothetical protein